jgi:hypothetical protein
VSLLYTAQRLRVLILSVQFEVKKKNKFWKQANILPSPKLQVLPPVQLLLVHEVYLECDIRAILIRVCPLVILKLYDPHDAAKCRQNNFHYLREYPQLK